MATRLTAGRTPSKVLSNIIRLVDAARLCEGGSLAAPDVRLSELRRDLASYLLMSISEQHTMMHEATWRSKAGRMALVHTFLSALRVVCDPRAIAPDDTTAPMLSGLAKGELYETTRAGSKANSVPGRSIEVCEGAPDVLACTSGILGHLFLSTVTSSERDLPVQNRCNIPAAAAEMVEELLRGDCLPLTSRLLASGVVHSMAACTPSSSKAAADGANMFTNMVHSLLLLGMSEPVTRGMVLAQLPACRLVELWGRAAADQEGSSNPNSSVLYLGRQTDDGTAQRVAEAMRETMCVLLPTLLRHRSEGGEPLRSVLSGPCLQYLVALQAVSQLHAADGGTLYGLPPAAVLPPELAEEEEEQGEGHGSRGGGRRQGPAALSCDVLTVCVAFWESCVTGQPRVHLGPLRNRCLVNLCMRLSRVALASLEGAEVTAAQPQTGKGDRSVQGQQQQQQQQRRQGDAEAGSNPSGEPPPASGVASVALRRPLEAGTCASVALQSLNLAATVLRSPEGDRRTHGGSSSSDGGGGGSSSSSGSGGSSSAGSDGDGTNGMELSCAARCCCSSVGDGSTSVEAGGSMRAVPPTSTRRVDSPADGHPVASEPPADPRLCSRSFGRRWWPLAVGAVQAALRQPAGMDWVTLSLCCEMLRISAEPQVRDPGQRSEDLLAQLLEPAGSGPPDGQQRCDLQPLSSIPPGLAAALSAGLLPTLTALVRSSCSPAPGGVAGTIAPMDPMDAVMQLVKPCSVAYGGEVLLLLSHGDAAQAAALLTALAKASLGLMPAAGTRATGWMVYVTPTLVINLSSTFSSLVSGLLPPEETRWDVCAWAWPRRDGGDGGGEVGVGGGGGGPAEAEAVAPPYRQLLRLASFVLHTWLPVLARMHDIAAKLHVPRKGRKPQDVPAPQHDFAGKTERFLKGHLQQGVRLAARACRAAWLRGDARAVGSWRQLLQRNVCAARWVGAEVVAGWEAEGWWPGPVGQQRVAEAEVKEQQPGEEGQGQAGVGGAGSEEEEEEAWPYPLPLAPCESAALLRA